MTEDRLVGVYLESGSAVFAVVRRAPLRLVAVAEVALPSQAAGPARLRALDGSRRQLRLPRWFPIALTAARESSAQESAAYAVLLARAGLPVAWLPAPDTAAHRWSTAGVRLDGPLAALSGDRALALAAGAALHAFNDDTLIAVDQAVDESVGDGDDGRGWSVQRLADPAQQGRTR